MKALLVVFMLCGQPYYIVGGDEQGPLVGPLSAAPQEAVDKINALALNPTTIIIKRSLEDISGGRCA